MPACRDLVPATRISAESDTGRLADALGEEGLQVIGSDKTLRRISTQHHAEAVAAHAQA